MKTVAATGWVAAACFLAACGTANPGEEGALPDAHPADTLPLTRSVLAAARGGALPDGVDVERIRAGARVFHGGGGCHVCHGPDARGARGVGADLTDAEWWHTDGSVRGLTERIRVGVPADSARNVWGAAMPPRGGSSIDDADVAAAAAYVWALRLLEGG